MEKFSTRKELLKVSTNINFAHYFSLENGRKKGKPQLGVEVVTALAAILG